MEADKMRADKVRRWLHSAAVQVAYVEIVYGHSPTLPRYEPVDIKGCDPLVARRREMLQRNGGGAS